MASYTVATAERGAYGKTLSGNTVDTVTFSEDQGHIEIVSDGAAALYYTVDGDTPTVAGGHCYCQPIGCVSVREVDAPRQKATVVKLISSGTPTYSVSRADGLQLGGAKAA